MALWKSLKNVLPITGLTGQKDLPSSVSGNLTAENGNAG